MQQDINFENWRLFVRRGPVNLRSQRSLRCKLNSAVLPLLERQELLGLIEATKENWETLTAQITDRLRASGKIP
jgi:hypothetical protein